MTFWHRRTRRKLETTDYFFVADRDSEEGRLIVRSAVDVGFHSGRGAAAFIISCTSGLIACRSTTHNHSSSGIENQIKFMGLDLQGW